LRRSQQGEPPGGRAVNARRFLYLDSTATKELLAGLERGTYGVERESRNQEAGREVGGKIGVGVLGADVGVHAGRTTSAGQRIERDLAQTPESLFSRLIDALREQGFLRHLDTLDASTWATLKPGHIIEIVASVSVGTLHKLADAVVRAQAVNRTYTDEPGGSIKEKALCRLLVRLYTLARQVPGVDVDLEVVAVIPESSEFVLRAKLDAREIRTELHASEDHATLLGKIDRMGEQDAEVTLLGIYR
jgi:hypothetical protein